MLGELVTEEKSNEITAVPELIDTLNLAGSIVTADAMSCQKTIVKKICTAQFHYKRKGPWQNRKTGIPFVDGLILACATDRMGGAERSWFRLFHCDQKWCN